LKRMIVFCLAISLITSPAWAGDEPTNDRELLTAKGDTAVLTIGDSTTNIDNFEVVVYGTDWHMSRYSNTVSDTDFLFRAGTSDAVNNETYDTKIQATVKADDSSGTAYFRALDR